MGSSSHSTPKSVKPKSGDTSESTKHYRIRKSADRLAARHFSPFPSHWALGLVALEFVCFIKYHESGNPLAFLSNRRIRFRVQKQVVTMSTSTSFCSRRHDTEPISREANSILSIFVYDLFKHNWKLYLSFSNIAIYMLCAIYKK